MGGVIESIQCLNRVLQTKYSASNVLYPMAVDGG